MDEATIQAAVTERIRAELRVPPPAPPPDLWGRIVRDRRREPWRLLAAGGSALGAMALVVALGLATFSGGHGGLPLQPTVTERPDVELAAVRATLAAFAAGVVSATPSRACPYLAGDGRSALACDDAEALDVPLTLREAVDGMGDIRVVDVSGDTATAQIPYPRVLACRSPKGIGPPQILKLRKLRAGWRITRMELAGSWYALRCVSRFKVLPGKPVGAYGSANAFALALFQGDLTKACEWLTGDAARLVGCDGTARRLDGPLYGVAMWGRPVRVTPQAGGREATAVVPYFVPNGCTRAAAIWANDKEVRLRLEARGDRWLITEIEAPGPLGACPLQRQTAR
jgi:hypothetical protein